MLNETKNLTCIVNDGVPEPVIKWKLIDLSDHSNFIYFNTSQMSTELNNGSPVYKSVLNLTGTFGLQNKKISCIVEQILLPKPIVSTIKLDFKCKYIRIIYMKHFILLKANFLFL